MRIAVLLTGQARYLQQSGFWHREKVFPKTFQNIKVDYYVYLWDDGSDDLADRIVSAYDPVKFEIGDYNEAFHNHRHQIKQANIGATDWNFTNDYMKHVMCYEGDQYDSFSYNFPGMYLASARGARMAGSLSEYDIVIKSRTDNMLNNMQERQWIQLLSNMNKNPVFSDTLFTPWMRIRQGLPFFGDLCFVGKPNLMYNFLHNIDNQMIRMATADKHLLSDFLIDPEIPFAHWLWSRCSLYSKTDWLAISVVWPVPFGSALLRQDVQLYDRNYAFIEGTYNTEEQRRHEELSHQIGLVDK
tara:strand:+ start:53 stop:952 length:900 start_codon:yes stop_codon:yes gene_type:complete